MYNTSNIKLNILISGFIVILLSHPLTSINAQTTTIKKPIRLGLTLWVPFYLAYVAEDKGYFKKNNVDVNLTLINNYNEALNSYSNGDYDGISGVYSDFIIRQSEGIDSKVVYVIDNSNSADAIVGKGNNLADVKGEKIGIGGINSFSHYFVLKSLEKVGLSEGDVEFVDVPVQNVTSALQNGQIFAGHSYYPFISAALKQGYKILYFAGNIPGIITDVLAFHSDIIQNRPHDIQQIIKSIDEAKTD